MTAFLTRVHGIPCQCEVINHTPAKPMHVYGPGMGDCHPPEPEEFDFELLDRRGRRAEWLDKYISTDVEVQMLLEWSEHAARYYAPEPDEHAY